MGRTYTPEQVRKRYIKQIVKDGNTRIAWHLTYPPDTPKFELRPKRFFGECPAGKVAIDTWADRYARVYHTRLASMPRKVYWSVRPASGIPIGSVWSAVYGQECEAVTDGKVLYMTRSRHRVTRFTTSRKGWIRNRRRLRHKGTFKVYVITALLSPEEHNRVVAARAARNYTARNGQ